MVEVARRQSVLFPNMFEMAKREVEKDLSGDDSNEDNSNSGSGSGSGDDENSSENSDSNSDSNSSNEEEEEEEEEEYDDEYYNRRRRRKRGESTLQNNNNEEEEEDVPEWKQKARKFMDGFPYQITMGILTIYVLFADDVKMLTTTKEVDPIFSIICIVLMGVFFVELIASSIILKDYFLGFYFWLDLVSCVSMLLDIHWFYDWFIDVISKSGSAGSTNSGNKAKSIGSIAKAGKSAKIAARAIRILRVIRIVRLVRVSKLYKARAKLIKLQMERKEELAKKEREQQQQQNQQNQQQQNQQLIDGQQPQQQIEGQQPQQQNVEMQLNQQNQQNNNLLSTPKKESHHTHTLSPSKQGNQSPSKAPESPSKKGKGKTDDIVSVTSKDSNDDLGEGDEDENNGEVPEESKVGKLLSERTNKKVIILVLVMMISIILFNASFYLSKKTGMEMGLKIFTNYDSMNNANLNLSFSIYVSENLGTDSPLVYLKVGSMVYGDEDDANNLRTQEKNNYTENCYYLDPSDTSSYLCTAVFDTTYANKISSVLNIAKTIFICIVLTVSSFCFSKDTQEMVLEPIETMITKVKQISKNPIQALQKNEKEEITKAIMEEEEEKNKCCNCGPCKDESSNTNSNFKRNNNKTKEVPLETEILESTITKIGALLALSFGDAGSEIIAKNMQRNSSGEVNPMIAGKKVMAIYGFCDIRNFTDTTEILQEKVMLFVNEIAEIVHENCSEYGGSANKNIGDAFLLVWKFDEKFTYKSKRTKEICVYNCDQVNQLCDMSLISIIKMFAKIYKSKTLDKYRKNKKLIKKFNGYMVRIGFGLHLGWSIEGAIGSSFKIDASYLSPNANMANGCEERTKEYGALLIMTDKFAEMLSDEARSCLRMIDIINMNTDEPLGLFTVDMDLFALTIDEEESESQQFFNDDPNMNNQATRKMMKYQKRLKRNKNLADAMAFPPKRQFWMDFVENSDDWQLMRQKYTENFYKNYNLGFDEFNFGDWGKAKEYLETALSVIPDDKSTIRMLDKMKSMNYQKPSDWAGNTE